MSSRTRQAGLTIIELMVTLFVVSILVSLAGTSFSTFTQNNRMAIAVNDINSVIHLARTEAIKRNASVSICASTSYYDASPDCDASATFDDGWILFIDATSGNTPNLKVDSGDTIIKGHGPSSDGLILSVADTTNAITGIQFISFRPNGYPYKTIGGKPATVNLQLCDSRGNKDTGGGIAAGRWINITPTGRPQMHRDQTTVEHANNPNGGCTVKTP